MLLLLLFLLLILFLILLFFGLEEAEVLVTLLFFRDERFLLVGLDTLELVVAFFDPLVVDEAMSEFCLFLLLAAAAARRASGDVGERASPFSLMNLTLLLVLVFLAFLLLVEESTLFAFLLLVLESRVVRFARLDEDEVAALPLSLPLFVFFFCARRPSVA